MAQVVTGCTSVGLFRDAHLASSHAMQLIAQGKENVYVEVERFRGRNTGFWANAYTLGEAEQTEDEVEQ